MNLLLQDSTFVKPTFRGFVDRIKNELDVNDMIWMVFFTAVTYGLYKLATLNLHDERRDWTRVLLYFAVCGGLIAAYFTFGHYDVAPLAPTSYIIMGVTFLSVCISLLMYARVIKDFAKITNGIVIISIGFLMIYSVIIDRLGYAYSFMFSLMFAIGFARMILATTLFPPMDPKKVTSSKSKYSGGNKSSI